MAKSRPFAWSGYTWRKLKFSVRLQIETSEVQIPENLISGNSREHSQFREHYGFYTCYTHDLIFKSIECRITNGQENRMDIFGDYKNIL